VTRAERIDREAEPWADWALVVLVIAIIGGMIHGWR